MTSNIKLPKTPTVIARKESVVIHFASGSEILWAVEQNVEEAEKVAKELEVELRAVKYVQWHVHSFIQDMKEYLESLSIDIGLLDSILMDGHVFARSDLKKDTVDSIILGAERGLRKLVIDNLDSDLFIV
jgi:hypothetical protein